MNYEDGIVIWFSEYDGTGVIRVGNESIFIHYSAINIGKPYKPGDYKEFVYRLLFPNQKVKVKITRDSHYTQISELI